MITAPVGALPAGRNRKPSQSPPKRTRCDSSAMLSLPPADEQGVPALLPGVPLVQHRRHVDEAKEILVERGVDLAVDGHAVRRLDEVLAFRREYEVGKQ